MALASLLAGQHDLLLLDEPTNHLDVEAVAWLAGFLRDQGTAMVVVTHDRWFLDAATTRTWELADGRLHAYDGGYAAYVLARAERARVADATERRRRNLLRKELAWLRRGPPARTSKPRFRIDAANALIADEPEARNGVELVRLATARLGKTVIDVFDVSVAVAGRVLFDDVSWQLGPGDRIGIVGPNGAGRLRSCGLLAGAPAGGEGRPAGHLAADRTPRPGDPPAGPAADPGRRLGRKVRWWSLGGWCAGRRCSSGTWGRGARGWIPRCRRGRWSPPSGGIWRRGRARGRSGPFWRAWDCGGTRSGPRPGSCLAGSGGGFSCWLAGGGA